MKRINTKSILRETTILKQLFIRGWRHYEKPLDYLLAKEITRIDKTLLQRLENLAKTHKPKNKKITEYL